MKRVESDTTEVLSIATLRNSTEWTNTDTSCLTIKTFGA